LGQQERAPERTLTSVLEAVGTLGEAAHPRYAAPLDEALAEPRDAPRVLPRIDVARRDHDEELLPFVALPDHLVGAVDRAPRREEEALIHLRDQAHPAERGPGERHRYADQEDRQPAAPLCRVRGARRAVGGGHDPTRRAACVPGLDGSGTGAYLASPA